MLVLEVVPALSSCSRSSAAAGLRPQQPQGISLGCMPMGFRRGIANCSQTVAAAFRV